MRIYIQPLTFFKVAVVEVDWSDKQIDLGSPIHTHVDLNNMLGAG